MSTEQKPVVVVTGGNRGLGKEVCRQMSAAGYEVILGARSTEQAEEVAGELGTQWVALDVTDAAGIEKAAVM